MKTVTLYQCENCGRPYTDQASAVACEAAHLGLKPEEYMLWKSLSRKAASAGHHVGICKNPETDRAFDDAIRELTDFEISHRIPNGWRKPLDFFC